MIDSGTGVAEQTKRIAFLGTPFQGSDKAKWAETIAAKLDKLGLKKANKELLKHLENDSVKLKTLGEGFPQWLRRREGDPATRVGIVCFAEEFGDIVPKESAKLPGHELRILPATHVEMCKFSSDGDTSYRRVRDVLREWVDEIKAGVGNDNNSQVRVHQNVQTADADKATSLQHSHPTRTSRVPIMEAISKARPFWTVGRRPLGLVAHS